MYIHIYVCIHPVDVHFLRDFRYLIPPIIVHRLGSCGQQFCGVMRLESGVVSFKLLTGRTGCVCAVQDSYCISSFGNY